MIIDRFDNDDDEAVVENSSSLKMNRTECEEQESNKEYEQSDWFRIIDG